MSPRKEINIGLIIGMLYAVFIKITGISIPCLFREITGLKCPGCGITTFFMNLLFLSGRKTSGKNNRREK